MKKRMLLFCALILGVLHLNCQTISALASFPGEGREGASTFTINNVIYMVAGINDVTGSKQEVWAYYVTTNTWIQKHDAPWPARFFGVAFSINNKGYFGGGNLALGRSDNVITASDFYQYDPETDRWSIMAAISPTGVYGATAFSIGNKGYVAFGANGVPYNSAFTYIGTPVNKIYEFDPSNGPLGTWNLVATTSNGYAAINPQSFVINGKAYIAGGFVPGTLIDQYSGVDGVTVANCVQFDPSNYSITAMSSMPSTYQRHFGSSFSLFDRGYVLGGNYSYDYWVPAVSIWSTLKSDLLEFNPYSNSWSVVSNSTNVGYNSRAVSVVSCYRGYILGGVSTVNGSTSYSHANFLFAADPDVDYLMGPRLICSSGQYSLQSQPPGTTLTWTSNNSNILTITSAGAAARVGSATGGVIVSANLADASCSFSLPISVWVGSPSMSLSVDGASGSYPLCSSGTNLTYTANADHTVQATTNGSAPTFTLNTNSNLVSGSMLNSNTYDFISHSTSPNFTITASSNNSCGTTSQCLYFSNSGPCTLPQVTSVYINGSPWVTDCASASYTYSPNVWYTIQVNNNVGTPFSFSASNSNVVTQTVSANTFKIKILNSNTSFAVWANTSNSCGSAGACIWFSNSGGPAPSAVINKHPKKINAFPNPSSSSLTVEVSDSLSVGSELSQSYQLFLMNRFSQTVFSVQSWDKTIHIPVENLPADIYYLNVFYGDAVLQKQIEVKK